MRSTFSGIRTFLGLDIRETSNLSWAVADQVINNNRKAELEYLTAIQIIKSLQELKMRSSILRRTANHMFAAIVVAAVLSIY